MTAPRRRTPGSPVGAGGGLERVTDRVPLTFGGPPSLDDPRVAAQVTEHLVDTSKLPSDGLPGVGSGGTGGGVTVIGGNPTGSASDVPTGLWIGTVTATRLGGASVQLSADGGSVWAQNCTGQIVGVGSHVAFGARMDASGWVAVGVVVS